MTYHDPNDPSLPNASTAAWFESINQPVIPTPPKRKHHHRAILLSVCSFLLLVGVGVGISIWLNRPPACLSDGDYKEFVGSANEDPLSPQVNFYSLPVEFTKGTANYTSDSAGSMSDFISKTGAFYKKHSANTSIVVTVSSDYIEGTSRIVAEQRSSLLKDSLLRAGVAPSALVIETPQAITTEPDSPLDDIPGSITITSSAQCR